MCGVDEVFYLSILLLILNVFVLIFDLGLDIEEGTSRILLSALAAALLRK